MLAVIAERDASVKRAEVAEAELALSRHTNDLVRRLKLDAQAERDALRAQVAALREAFPVVGKQGIGFGNCWLSFDKMLGYEGEEGADRDAFYASRIIARELVKWANNALAATASVPPADKKEDVP